MAIPVIKYECRTIYTSNVYSYYDYPKSNELISSEKVLADMKEAWRKERGIRK